MNNMGKIDNKVEKMVIKNDLMLKRKKFLNFLKKSVDKVRWLWYYNQALQTRGVKNRVRTGVQDEGNGP